jgi:Transcriptional regulators
MTNKELAAMLNVSETAFSFIINNRPGISEKTRSRVLSELKALGYENLIKTEEEVKPESSVVYNISSKNIGFVIYKKHGKLVNDSPFFLLLLESIDTYVHSLGYHIYIRMISEKSNLEEQIDDLEKADLSGVILFATEMQMEDMRHFHSFSKPIVILDNDFTYLNHDSVVINNSLGTYQAIKYLVDLGHKTIGYLQSDTIINSFRERCAGYKQALNMFGLELEERYRFLLSYSEDQSYKAFKKILDTKYDFPTAFVSDDDTITLGVIRAIQEKAPFLLEQISFIGFNDRPLCDMSNPTLTSIAVPKDTFGVLAARTLIERIENKYESTQLNFHKISVGVQLIARNSTRSPNIRT